MIYKEKNMKRVRAILVGTFIGMILSTALLMLATMVFLQIKSIPVEAVGLMTQLFGAISAFAASYVAVRIAKERGMLIGIITGLFLFLIILLVGLATTTESMTAATLTKALVMAIAGCIGGIIAVNKKQRVK